jgi:hypothetical protein
MCVSLCLYVSMYYIHYILYILCTRTNVALVSLGDVGRGPWVDGEARRRGVVGARGGVTVRVAVGGGGEGCVGSVE